MISAQGKITLPENFTLHDLCVFGEGGGGGDGFVESFIDEIV